MNCVYLPKKIFFFFLPFLPSFLATNDDEFDCFAFHSIFSPFHAIQHSEWFNFLSPYGILHSIRPMMGTSSDIRFAIYSSPMSSPLKRTKKKKLFSCCFHYTNRNFYRIIFFFFFATFYLQLADLETMCNRQCNICKWSTRKWINAAAIIMAWCSYVDCWSVFCLYLNCVYFSFSRANSR